MSNSIGPGGLSGCFRCACVWVPREVEPRLCPRCKSRLWDAPVIRPVRRGTGLGVDDIIKPKREEMSKVLTRHKARNPKVFGSIARGEGTKDSDLDLLVEFDASASAFDQVALINDLEDVFGRRVDIAEPGGLHWLIRPQILFEAVSV
ncbi:MAG TPA: nucleotidyltransferase family protein [Thermoplasmata archaeon]|nr:nucleotidyltransferase family protein [Thermoplasmata archaeon]